MWKELEVPKRQLPVGVITVEYGRMRFATKTVNAWHLDRYNYVKILQEEDNPQLIAFQLLEKHAPKTIPIRHSTKIARIAAAWLIHDLNIKFGRYSARKDKNLIIVDFSRLLTDKQVDDRSRYR